MLSVINRYLHGYVVIPCYVEFQEKGIFQFLKSSSSFEEIISTFKANPGHLKVALRIFESLNWISKNPENQYQITSDFPEKSEIPPSLKFLYKDIQLESYLESSSPNSFDELIFKLDLPKWLPLMSTQWHVSSERLSDFLNSPIIVPLFYFMKNKLNIKEGKIKLSALSEISKKNILKLFSVMGLGENNGNYLTLTALGEALQKSILNAGTILSYQPMLSQMETLLFGDAQKIFQATEEESHVSRELNVRGSGTQHRIFFSDFHHYIASYVKELKFQDLPHAIVDMGCGDGSLLRVCYDALGKGSNIIMIGADFDLKALKVASETLKNIPHRVIKGDISNPLQLLLDLKDKKISDKDRLLHIRSFLDHDRFYKSPQNQIVLKNRQNILYEGVYVNNEGQLISAAAVVQNLVEHFKNWADIIGRHGMITLEVFCLDPKIVNRYLDETENLHFDAYHGFSQQLLVEADVYLMCAAESGLFPTKKGFKKYPTILPYTRITRQHFFKRPYVIRHPYLEDLTELINIQNKTMPSHLQTKEPQLRFLLEQYPQGQYVMEIDGRIVGVLFTQRIEDESNLYEMRQENIETYHNPLGEIVQLIGLYIAVLYQGKELSIELLEFALLHNFVRSGVKKISGISRCSSYSQNKHISLNNYIKLRNSIGWLIDPILNIHDQMGADIIGLVPNFRINDIENQGFGVHIEYRFSRWQKNKKRD